MTISGQPATSLLESALAAESTRTEIGISLLKKSNDLVKEQGAAMIDMLEKSAPPPIPEGRLLDVYA